MKYYIIYNPQMTQMTKKSLWCKGYVLACLAWVNSYLTLGLELASYPPESCRAEVDHPNKTGIGLERTREVGQQIDAEEEPSVFPTWHFLKPFSCKLETAIQTHYHTSQKHLKPGPAL